MNSDFVTAIQDPTEKAQAPLPPDDASLQPTHVFNVKVSMNEPMFTTTTPVRAESIVWLPRVGFPFVKRLVDVVPGTVGTSGTFEPSYIIYDPSLNIPNICPLPVSVGGPTSNLYFGFFQPTHIPVESSRQPTVSPSFVSAFVTGVGRCIAGTISVSSDAAPVLGAPVPTGSITSARIPGLDALSDFNSASLANRASFAKDSVLYAKIADGATASSGIPYGPLQPSFALQQQHIRGNRVVLRRFSQAFAWTENDFQGKWMWLSPYAGLRSNSPFPSVTEHTQNDLAPIHPGPWSFPDFSVSVRIRPGNLSGINNKPLQADLICASVFMQIESATGVGQPYHVMESTRKFFCLSTSIGQHTFSTQQQASQSPTFPSEAIWIGSLLGVNVTLVNAAQADASFTNIFDVNVSYDASRYFTQDARVWRYENVGDQQVIQLSGDFTWQVSEIDSPGGSFFSATSFDYVNPSSLFELASQLNTSKPSAQVPLVFKTNNQRLHSDSSVSSKRAREY